MDYKSEYFITDRILWRCTRNNAKREKKNFQWKNASSNFIDAYKDFSEKPVYVSMENEDNFVVVGIDKIFGFTNGELKQIATSDIHTVAFDGKTVWTRKWKLPGEIKVTNKIGELIIFRGDDEGGYAAAGSAICMLTRILK